jgi:uncharacterized protein DUF2330
MTDRMTRAGSFALALLVVLLMLAPTPACCPAPPSGKPVVNADQTVVLIWDAATKTQHFIRQAAFKSDADDFGFLVPTPSRPELSESGDDAFPYLKKLTEPEVQKVHRPSGGTGCGCASEPTVKSAKSAAPKVAVLEEKLVAGFNAAVLETKSTAALVGWLREHGYSFSPEVEAWAKPYVEGGWMITALKVAKDKTDKEKKDVGASALRMSFHTDRPVFPYREPDPRSYAAALKAEHRLLRVYFLAEGRYKGELTKDVPWTGKVAWSNPLSEADRSKVLQQLNLPEATGPSQCWLTEFEDEWPYQAAPADVYFSRDSNQTTVKRPPIIEYVRASWPDDVSGYALAVALVLPPLLRRIRPHRRK